MVTDAQTPSVDNRQLGNRSQSMVEPTVSDIVNEVGETFKIYAKERPEVVAMWSFGIGFVLAWKLKPW